MMFVYLCNGGKTAGSTGSSTIVVMYFLQVSEGSF